MGTAGPPPASRGVGDAPSGGAGHLPESAAPQSSGSTARRTAERLLATSAIRQGRTTPFTCRAVCKDEVSRKIVIAARSSATAGSPAAPHQNSLVLRGFSAV